MDFQKAFENLDNDFGSNLTQKIGKPPELSTSQYLCMWSDLLGFGDVFFKNKWELSDSEKERIYDRLQKAHSAVLYYSSIDERNLILNDGIAKIFKIQENDPYIISHISLFIRSAIQLHIAINKIEAQYNYPGSRTVLAQGEGVEYLVDEIRYDDYILNYTKPGGTGKGSLARKGVNPIIIYNPKELQMNTAFSKAFTLENGGSKIGLKGNNFHIDQSVLTSISKMAEANDLKAMYIEDGDNIEFLIPHSLEDINEVLMGFKLSKPITVVIKQWETQVYEVLNFYPHDENRSDFSFDLGNKKIAE